jgi:hypothetical protein
MAAAFKRALITNCEKTELVDTLAGVYTPLQKLMTDYPAWAEELRTTLRVGT